MTENSEEKEKKRVLVFGGTGYVGEAIVDKLIEHNFEPVLIVRNLKKLEERWIGKIVTIETDIKQLNNFKNEVKVLNIYACIYSIGLLFEGRNNKFIDSHYNWVKDTVNLCKEIGIERYLLVSANGVRQTGTKYQISKWSGEQYVAKSGLKYTIFRPSIIFDNSKKFNFTQILYKMVSLPIAPVISTGEYILALVYRGDVAEAMVKSIENLNANNLVFALRGPTDFTFNDLLDITAKYRNKFIIKVHIPIFFVNVLTTLYVRFKFFPIDPETIHMLLEGNTNTDDFIWKDLNIERKSYEQFLKEQK